MSNKLKVDESLEALNERIGRLEKKFLEPVAQGIVDGMMEKYLGAMKILGTNPKGQVFHDSCTPLPRHDLHAGWAKQEKQEFLSFGDAVKKMKMGKFITRYMWRNPKIYCFLRDEELRVNTAMGKECPWTPNSVELLAEDWIVV